MLTAWSQFLTDSSRAAALDFNQKVASYEHERRGPVRAVVASVLGDGAIPVLDTTTVPFSSSRSAATAPTAGRRSCHTPSLGSTAWSSDWYSACVGCVVGGAAAASSSWLAPRRRAQGETPPAARHRTSSSRACSKRTGRCSNRSGCAPRRARRQEGPDRPAARVDDGRARQGQRPRTRARARSAQGVRRAHERAPAPARGVERAVGAHPPAARGARQLACGASGASGWPRTCCGSRASSRASTIASRRRSRARAGPTTRSCCRTAS